MGSATYCLTFLKKYLMQKLNFLEEKFPNYMEDIPLEPRRGMRFQQDWGITTFWETSDSVS